MATLATHSGTPPRAANPVMQTNGIELLKAQHAEIRVLLEVVATEPDATLRAAAFKRMTQLFVIHETAEEQVLRPATEAYLAGGGRLAAERSAEETQARQTLMRLSGLGTYAADFDASFAPFRTAVLAHLDAEEAEEFAAVRRGQLAGSIPQLGEALEAAEDAVPVTARSGSTQT
jgi:hypothetical protein